MALSTHLKNIAVSFRALAKNNKTSCSVKCFGAFGGSVVIGSKGNDDCLPTDLLSSLIDSAKQNGMTFSDGERIGSVEDLAISQTRSIQFFVGTEKYDMEEQAELSELEVAEMEIKSASIEHSVACKVYISNGIIGVELAEVVGKDDFFIPMMMAAVSRNNLQSVDGSDLMGFDFAEILKKTDFYFTLKPENESFIVQMKGVQADQECPYCLSDIENQGRFSTLNLYRVERPTTPNGVAKGSIFASYNGHWKCLNRIRNLEYASIEALTNSEAITKDSIKGIDVPSLTRAKARASGAIPFDMAMLNKDLKGSNKIPKQAIFIAGAVAWEMVVANKYLPIGGKFTKREVMAAGCTAWDMAIFNNNAGTGERFAKIELIRAGATAIAMLAYNKSSHDDYKFSDEEIAQAELIAAKARIKEAKS